MNEISACSKKSLLLLLAISHLIRGISSHLASLLPDLIDDGYSVTSLSPGVYDRVEHHGDFKYFGCDSLL